MHEAGAWHLDCNLTNVETPITSAEEAAMRVRIVEHEEELRMLLAEEFRKRGVEVLEAANEFEALWQSQHKHPDVILIDLTLPEFGGLPVKRMRVFSAESLPIN